jgi:capsular exopolysaccharide synthesis family protein
MKLMGTVPAKPSGFQRLGQTKAKGERWQSALHESVNAAREMLLHMARAESVRVVMVTSAVAGEGKTSLTTQLASSLARAGRKILLIDCDLRNPAAHRVFELPHAPGVSEILRDEIDPADAIQDTTVHGLSLLAAGHWDNEAMIALARGGVEKLFERMRQRFDFVLVDTSPVLPVADAIQVAQHVDGVIFSVLRNVSQLPRVYHATQRLTGLGIRLLGAVVLGTREDVGSYGYNYTAPRRARTTQVVRGQESIARGGKKTATPDS